VVPQLWAMARILLIMGLIGVVLVGSTRWKEYGLPQLLALILAFWLLNGCFSIFASPGVWRYQIFLLFVVFAIDCLLIEKICRLAKEE